MGWWPAPLSGAAVPESLQLTDTSAEETCQKSRSVNGRLRYVINVVDQGLTNTSYGIQSVRNGVRRESNPY